MKTENPIILTVVGIVVVVGMEDEAEETKSAARIFVGGLAEAVSAEDLRSLFASLGSVQSVQTIRTKGRSFAYLDFLSDPKSLSKLFSKASTNYSLSLFFLTESNDVV